ncbi:hypothetical protein GFB56_12335 [Ensifer sp. T173]|uniref:Uncharacterized protein n=1 Tax=Ensifer canadensis TaxID=555315 RepID=A0AAW4FHK5_9HYPH|nr:hypothetical protein [Ensifer canadensis]MBM3091604.1 hypothetical protein [Ensifer canadensis]UBI74411.1 hypothetical protein J3R84_13020 [Ensifer canadensis]
MKPAEKQAAARAMLDNPLFHLIMDDLEASAINGCINAPVTDDETRGAFAAEARAIRKFRSKLKFLAEEQATADGKGAPA